MENTQKMEVNRFSSLKTQIKIRVGINILITYKYFNFVGILWW